MKEKMRLLLISPNKEQFPPAYPLGLNYLASYIRGLGHDVSVLDLLKLDDEVNEIKTAINNEKPDIVGISIRNIDNCLSNVPKLYYNQYKLFIDVVKNITSVPIILGGAGFSILPEQLLNYYDLKFGIVGEGEEALSQFIDRLQRKESFDGIPGLVQRINGEYKINPHKNTFRLDSDKSFFPLREKNNINMYKPDGRLWMNIQSRRGCSEACIYCVYPYLEGCRMRFRDVKSIGDELEYLDKELNVGLVSFVDGVFNNPVDFAVEICEEILHRNLSFEWNAALSVDPNFLSVPLLKLMKRSGCRVADFSGTDTASEIMLRKMRKNYNKADIVEGSRRCREAGLKVIHSLLLGGPGETADTIKESFELMEKINPDTLWANVGIRIYPNTEIYNIACSENYLIGEHSLLNPVYYLAPTLSETNFREIVSSYRERHSSWALTCLAENYSEWVTEIIKYADSLQNN